jgi:hypothetical protein
MTSISDGDLVRITGDVPNDAQIEAGDVGSVARHEVVDGVALYDVYVEGKGEARFRLDVLEVVSRQERD